MKIINEIEHKSCNVELEMGEDEMSNLIHYADENIPKDILDELKIEWAINDLLLEIVNIKK